MSTQWRQYGQIATPTGIAVGMDGVIYVANARIHGIQCFDPNGPLLRKWGQRGKAAGEFNCPTGLSISPRDSMRHSILETMRTVPVLNVFPPGLLPLCSAYLGYDKERLYVADTSNHRIQIFECDGRFVCKWGGLGDVTGKLESPYDCAAGTDAVYVCDSFNYRIQVFDGDGTFVRSWGSQGYDEGQFIFPVGITVSNRHDLVYVSDVDNARVQCFRSDGTFHGQWGRHVLTRPIGLVVHDETVYVTDDANCVYVFRSNGTLITKLCSMGSGDWELQGPWGVTIQNNVLYVADRRNFRIVTMCVPIVK